jgi:hypothetical protein
MRDHYGRDRMVVGFMQSIPITTKVVSLNPTLVEVYSIQHYMTVFQLDPFHWADRPPFFKVYMSFLIKCIVYFEVL